MLRHASATSTTAPAGARRAAVVTRASSPVQKLASLGAAAVISTSLLLGAGVAEARVDKIAEFAASGLIFKDTVEVTALEDPEVEGVTLFFSDFKRSITDKLSKDFFTEPSQASLTCVATGPVKIKDMKKVAGSEGQEVFSEKKGLNFFTDKTLRVRRIYDPQHDALVYVSFSTRLTGANNDGAVSTGRYRTSICAVSAKPPPAPVIISTPAPAAVDVVAAPPAQ